MKALRAFFSRWWAGIALLALVPLLWVGAQTLTAVTFVPNSNFFKVWLAGHLVAENADPYSAEAWAGGHQQAESTWLPEKAFLYPLPLAVILSPLGTLTHDNGYIIWAFSSMVVCAASLLWLVNQWEETKYKLLAAPLLLAIFLFAPTLETAGKGTIGLLLMLGIMLAIFFFQKGWSFAAGVSLSLLAFKPQLGISILVIFGLWILFRKTWQAVFGLATGGAALLVIGLIADTHWISKFIESSQQKLGLTFGTQPTLFSAASLACNGQSSCTIFLGSLLTLGLLGLVSYLLFKHHKELSALDAANLAILTGVLITPYLWSYDHILLIIPLTWLTYQLTLRTKTYIVPIIFLAVIDVLAAAGLYFQALRPEKDFWSITVPVVTLVLVTIFILKPTQKQE